MGETTWSSFYVMFIWATCQQLSPKLFEFMKKLWSRLMDYFFPVIEIHFNEFSHDSYFGRNEAYTAIELYLSSKSTNQSTRLKGEFGIKSKSLALSMDEHQVVVDVFDGIAVKWFSCTIPPHTKSISYYPFVSGKRSYILSFHRKNREVVIDQYLKYVLEQGKAIGVRNRQRRLYTNNPSNNWWDYRKNLWSHVVFEHPATFDTLAIDTKLKEEIINDLVTFSNGKDYYAKTGKAWKRGYLLYGPPGTGKSTTIASMANFLGYDVYDIELTAVKDNTELRKLLTDISSKSVIVIEDIDCSLDLTKKRNKKKKVKDGKLEEEFDPIKKAREEEKDDDGDETNKVTLSGLLNFIDGLWSSCGGERIIIFTTNYKEKLDPALIRRGRMDQHIELSYCRFEAFKVLAKNYLSIDSHVLFDKIGQLLEETNMTPADVVEHLTFKTMGKDVDGNLENLVQALEKSKKEEAENKKQEEEKKKEEEEEEKKKEEEEKKKQEEEKKSLTMSLEAAGKRFKAIFGIF